MLLAVIGALVVAGSAFAVDRSELQPLPQPNLEEMRQVVRDKLERLRQRVEEVRSSGTDAELAEAYGTLGQHYLSQRLLDGARVALENAQALAPEDRRWPYLVGVIAENRGDHEAANASLTRAHELDPAYLPTLLYWGDVALALGDNEAALERFEQALERDRDSAAAHFGAGRALLAQRQYEGAAEHLERTLELQPDASVAHYPLAQALRGLRDREGAMQHLELRGDTEVFFSDPILEQVVLLSKLSAIDVIREMAWDAARGGSRDEIMGFAIAHLSTLIDAPQQLSRVIRSMQQDAAGLARDSEEMAVNRRARGCLHWVIGGLLEHHRQHERSAAELRIAVELVPEWPEPALQLAYALEQMGEFAAAVQLYDRLLDGTSPVDELEVLSYRAAALVEAGDVQRALADLEQLREALPEEVRYHVLSGVANAQLERFEAARAHYETALELNPDPEAAAQVHLHLGNIARENGDTEQALSEYLQAVQLDSELVAAGHRLAALLGTEERYEESAAAYRAVVEVDGRDVAARLGEAVALHLAGDDAQAVARLEEGWSAIPESVELLAALARLLASSPNPEVRDGERAVDLAERTFRVGATFDRMETLAMAHAAAGNWDTAVRVQQKLLHRVATRDLPEMEAHVKANLERYRQQQLPLEAVGQAPVDP